MTNKASHCEEKTLTQWGRLNKLDRIIRASVHPKPQIAQGRH